MLRRRAIQSPADGSPERKQRRAVGTGGEENPTRRVEHRVGVEPVAAGVERPDIVGNVERDAAAGLRPQEAADGDGLAAQCVAVEAVGRLSSSQ